MDKPYIITLNAHHFMEDGQEDQYEITAEGSLTQKRDKYYVSFEHTFDGMSQTKTTLKITPESVTMLRYGAMDTTFVFEPGGHYTGYYQTPFGGMSMAVTTKELTVNMTDGGGQLYVDYFVELNGAQTIQNQLQLTVRPA